MKTSIVEVGGMLSALTARGVEKQLLNMSGIVKAEVNYVSGSATVVYDETVTDLNTIKERIRDCGYHCTGEMLPKHVCVQEDPPAVAMHVGHLHETPAGHTHAEHPSHGAITQFGMPSAASQAGVAAHEMAHEMGHGRGMDLAAMAWDMRNRFWIALVFSVPIFIYSPMGGLFAPPAPPFGMSLNLWLFFLASAAVLYPSWPFFVAAWRVLRNGALNMAVLVVLSVGTGYMFSVGATFLFPGEQFYEAVAVLLVYMFAPSAESGGPRSGVFVISGVETGSS